MVKLSEEFLKPLVAVWERLLDKARQQRKGYDAVVDQCEQFVAGPVGFMHEAPYRNKYLRGTLAPKFRITLNRAFELIALFGPVMYNRNPVRIVRPHPRIDYPREVVAEAVGIPVDQLDQIQEAYQQAMEMHQAGQPIPPELHQAAETYQQVESQVEHALKLDKRDRNRIDVSCKLWEKYLSYTPKEQPDGGLKRAAEDALTEALVSGRGLLVPLDYTMPGSDRILTGCFQESQKNLLIDPDATSFVFGDARWIAIRHVNAWWELERKFKLPDGSLKDRATMESSEAEAVRETDDLGGLHKAAGDSHDLMVWWEVFSIGGPGSRLKGVEYEFSQAMEEACGDFCYMALAKGVPWFLNAHPERIASATMEDVGRMFQWPVPYWLDRRWPVAELDFFRWRKEPYLKYPLPPLAPGLGELTFMNIAVSAMANRIWNASRVFVGAQESIAKKIRQLMETGDDLVVFELERIQRNLEDQVKFFTVPDLSLDMWRIVDQMAQQFDRRVGLSELLYSLNVGGVASRSAKDADTKQQMAMIRPEKMADAVDDWMSEAARREKLCAYFRGVSGQDVAPLMGRLGSVLWDKLILNADPETVLREVDATVQSGTARKPNRDKDQANMQQLALPIGQTLTNYTQDSGWQQVDQLNAFHKKLFESMEQDGSGLELTPLPPPEPDPADAMEAEAGELELQMKQAEQQQDAQAAQQDLQIQAAGHQQDTTEREDVHDQTGRHLEEAHDLKMELEREKATVQNRIAAMKAKATAQRPRATNGATR